MELKTELNSGPQCLSPAALSHLGMAQRVEGWMEDTGKGGRESGIVSIKQWTQK